MKPDWYEDDALWEELRPVLFPEALWARVPQETDGILQLSGKGAGARVLDLCCGPGRHALELARRGCQVTGVDRTAAYLQEARQRAAGEKLELELVQADMREFCRPGAFDLALSLYTSIGYFPDPTDDLRVAQGIRRSLAPGGVFVADLMSKEVLSRIFKERDWEELSPGLLWLQERRLVGFFEGIEARWILVQEGRLLEHRLSHRLYSAVELCALLQQAGFSQISILGSLQGDPFDHQASRLVAVAT